MTALLNLHLSHLLMDGEVYCWPGHFDSFTPTRAGLLIEKGYRVVFTFDYFSNKTFSRILFAVPLM